MKGKIETCECGLAWQLQRVKMPHGARDSDSLNCRCGRELISWSGGHVYTMEAVEKELVQCPKGHFLQIWVIADGVRKLQQFACMECSRESGKSGEFHRETRTPIEIVR